MEYITTIILLLILVVEAILITREYKKRDKELKARDAEIQAILKSLEEFKLKNNTINN